MQCVYLINLLQLKRNGQLNFQLKKKKIVPSKVPSKTGLVWAFNKISPFKKLHQTKH